MKKDSQEVGKRYSSYANKYKKLFHNDHGDDMYLDLLVDYLSVGARILDVGCGTGRDIKSLSNRDFQVCGIDVSKSMVQLAKAENPDANVSMMDVTDMSFRDNSFDAVFSFYVLEHLKPSDFDKAILEIKRILKEDGLLLIVQHDDEIDGDIPDLMTDGKKDLYRYMIPLNKLRRYLRKNGFEVVFYESKKFSENTSAESADRELAILARNG